MKTKGKILAIALTAFMVLGLVPGLPMQTALAASYTVSTATELDDALTYIDSHTGLSHSITLNADISYYEKIWINRGTQLTLHLEGHQLNAYVTVQVDQLSRIALDDTMAGSAFNALGGVVVNSTGVATVTNASDPVAAYAIPAGAYDGGTLTVKGNVTAAHDTAIQCYDAGSTVTVSGNVVSTDENYCISASGGTVSINGSVQSADAGAMASAGGQITINGNVTTGDYGVYAYQDSHGNGGTITVNGIINAPYPVSIHDSHTVPTEQVVSGGYTVYTSSAIDASVVRVKLPTAVTAPTVTTGAAESVTASGATLNGVVTADGGATVTARGFVYGLSANPAIGSAGVTQATAGTGTGTFTAAITGISASTTYHVRAYATNSKGTSYGDDVTFTTAASTVIHVNVEDGGEIIIGAEAAWSGTPSNTHGALCWNGSAWFTNNTAAHTYFTNPSTGSRIKNYSDVAIPASAGTQAYNGVSFVAEEYSYQAQAADSSGTYQYSGKKYTITQADGKKIILLSRGLGRGTGTSYFEAFIENPTSGTLAIRNGSVLYSHVGTASESAAQNASSDGIFGLLRTADVYWLDINGGSDMGGITYSPHTATLSGTLVATAHPALSNQVVRFDLMLMAENSLYRYALTPSLTSESFIPASTAPTVTNLSPASGPEAGGTSVTITGTNFTDVSAVKFGGSNAAYTVNSPVRIIAVAPAGTGTVDISVTTAHGTSAASSADQFTYISASAPTVASVSPASGPEAGGTSVTITGTNFTDVSAVKFGGSNAAYTVNSPVKIIAVAPAGTGTAHITVTTAHGTSDTSSSDRFTYMSGGGGYISAAPTYTADIQHGGVKTDTLPVTVSGSAGTASLNTAKAAALFGSGNASVVMPSIPGVSAYTLEVAASALDAGLKGGALILSSGFGSMTISDNMLGKLTGTDGKTAGITIARGDTSGLTDAEKTAVGGRPVIQLTLTLDGIRTEWNNPEAPVTVKIPYTPTAEELENPEGIIIWYLDGSGKPVCVPNGRYDAATGTVTFATTHFSRYAVGYNAVSFDDVASGAWYGDAVAFVAARCITTGIANGNFSPDEALTRGQFVVMLMRAYGIAPDESPRDNFADAGNTYQTGYLAAAKRLGFAKGVGENLFVPDQAINRQEMLTLLYRALNVLGRLPTGVSGYSLYDFSDAASVASWAKDAVSYLVGTGTILGRGGKLEPTGAATRVEMACMLYRLMTEA